MSTQAKFPLYRVHELAFLTQYAELKDRARAAGPLLPGTPGHLVRRNGTGHAYWYRGYNAVPGQPVEDFVCKDGDAEALEAMRERIEFADWMARQVRDLRRLEFQVADKAVSRVLVELHNAGLFAGGLVLVGTLAYMSWLNELGAKTVAARTLDIDVARDRALKLAVPQPFLATVQATKLKFVPVPGMPSHQPPTTVKRPGAEGLRVDVLTSGPVLGQSVAVPELQWHAQTVPHYDFLLRDSVEAALMAGGQCVPLRIPAAERFVWHKLYASSRRAGDAAKAQKDLLQAATLASALIEQDAADLAESCSDAPADLRRGARSRLPLLRRVLASHAEPLRQLESALAG